MTINLKKTAEVILKEVKNIKQQRKEAIKVWLLEKRNRTFSQGLI
jgi:anti-sigma-K factor RskA